MTQSGDSANSPPLTFQDLTELYYARYKPLYNQVQTFNEMPVELIFEVAAAWDHVTRHWMYGESETSCAEMASRHVKRAVLDSFKLILKARVDEYEELRAIDTSIISNGNYDRDLRVLMASIRQNATDARTLEGDNSTPDSWSKAFDTWDRVHKQCEQFHREFYLNPDVAWARRKMKEFDRKRFWLAFLAGVGSSALVALIFWLLAWMLVGC